MIVRRFGVMLTVLALGGCNSDPTISGLAPGEGHGSLVVLRTDNVANSPARRVAISSETGASSAVISWFPNEHEAFPGAPFASDITLSRDGKWLAWVEFRRDTVRRYQDFEGNWRSDQHEQRIYVARIGASTKTLITPQYHNDYAPSFSPDGRRLVLLREFFDGDNQMITLARDGSDVQPVLIRRPQPRGAPDWSPANDRILYYRPDRGAVFAVSSDGSESGAILTAPFVGSPTWAPEGTRFAVTMFLGGRQQIAIVSANGTIAFTAPIQDGLAGGRIAWSPDGSRIAYCANAGAMGRATVVRVLTVANGEDRVITPAGYSDCNPIWRP